MFYSVVYCVYVDCVYSRIGFSNTKRLPCVYTYPIHRQMTRRHQNIVYTVYVYSHCFTVYRYIYIDR